MYETVGHTTVCARMPFCSALVLNYFMANEYHSSGVPAEDHGLCARIEDVSKTLSRPAIIHAEHM